MSTAALFGKLPAHGDFVRRGDPGETARLDAWLTREVERVARADGDALDARLSDLGCWAFTDADGWAGALAASGDRVGRVFPVVCLLPGARPAAEAAAALLARAQEERLDADELAAALVAIRADDQPPVDGTGRWWRPFAADPASFAQTGLPTGPDFDRLLVAVD